MEIIEQHVLNLKNLIEGKNYEILESYLIDNKPAPDWDNRISWYRKITLLYIAVKLRDAKAVALLIKHKADNVVDDNGTSLTSEDRLFLAPFYSDEEYAHLWKRRYLCLAGVFQGSLAEIKYWHEERGLFSDLTSNQFGICNNLYGNPLGQCAYSGYNDCVEYLVTKVGCDVNQEFFCNNYSTPLKAALINSHITTAELLVKLGADVHRSITIRMTRNSNINDDNVKQSLIHHLSQMELELDIEKEIKTRVEGFKWALKQGIDYDRNSSICDDYAGTALQQAPALVFACRSKAPELAQILIEDQRDKWINNGGPLLEVIPMINYYKIDQDRLVALVQLILPLVNPLIRNENLANALAAAILYEDSMYEDYLMNSLGADLKYMTKHEKYSYRLGKTFECRMKLAQNGIDIFTEQNESKDYMVARVEIPTKTAKLENIRKRMKNIKSDSEIYFEIGAPFTDPKFKKDWNRVVKPTNNNDLPPILLLDKKHNKIYQGVPAIEDLVLSDRTDPRMRYVPFWNVPEFNERFAVFVLAQKWTEKTMVLPKGYRIMFKPVSFEGNNQQHEGLELPNQHEKPNNDEEEDHQSKEDEDDGAPRRSSRVAKRKLEDGADPPVKRRKTRK